MTSDTTIGFLDEYRGDGPLRSISILDFSQMMMGPLATQLIADMGALVIKVERPDQGEWERHLLPKGQRLFEQSPYFLAMNRNKIGLAADLKNADDLALVKRLVKRVDAVVHNYRPGVMERLGLGFDDLVAINPHLVYAAGSGYGPLGPMVDRPGQDLLVQAMSGLAAASGRRSDPPVPLATPIVDASSALLLAFSVAAALVDARATGTPRRLDVSLLGTALLLQCQQAVVQLNMKMVWERSESGVAAPWADVPYGFFPTADGWIALALAKRQVLASIFEIPDRLLELDDEGWFGERDKTTQLIGQQTARRSTADWLDVFAERDLWAAPVLSLADALRHPQVVANGFIEQVSFGGGQLSSIGSAAKVSGMARAVRFPAPGVGQHDDVIRRALDRPEGSQA